MRLFLTLSRLIDTLTERIGRMTCWLVLAAVLISAVNATVRKLLNVGSNAFLEVQWYLFSAIFLIAAGYTLLRNEHVRIDVFSSRLTPRGRMLVDIVGIVFFLLPACGLILWLSWPFFVNAWVSGEMSSNAGGLVRWPVKLLIPVGFALLILQSLSELIKRIAFLRGLIEDPTARRTKSVEQEMAEDLRHAARSKD